MYNLGSLNDVGTLACQHNVHKCHPRGRMRIVKQLIGPNVFQRFLQTRSSNEHAHAEEWKYEHTCTTLGFSMMLARSHANTTYKMSLTWAHAHHLKANRTCDLLGVAILVGCPS